MKRFLYFLYIISMSLLIVSCQSPTTRNTDIGELSTLPQDATFYLEYSRVFEENKQLKDEYLSNVFYVWKRGANPNIEDTFWVKNSLLKSKIYGGNLKEIPLYQKEKMIESMDLSNYPNIEKNAIIINHTNARVLPTLLPAFSKQEGFPFDRWQNSLLYVGTPILATQMDTSGRFVHVESGFVSGWVELKDIAFIDKKYSDFLYNHKDFLMPSLDNIPIKDKEFLFDAKIGSIYPALTQKHLKKLNIKKTLSKNATYILVFTKDSNHKAIPRIIEVQKGDFVAFQSSLNPQQIASHINATLGQIYGWGGMYESRDCSAFVRDIFSSQSIFLPRNSGAQINFAKNKISLKDMNRQEKESYILQNATPFYTLLHFRGHILIYIGKTIIDGKERAVVAHSAFSTRSGSYENLLGGVVITTLYVGDEHNSVFNKKPLLIDRIASMSDLFEYVNNFSPMQKDE